MRVSFLNVECIVAIERYAHNDRVALELCDVDGECVAVATVNLPLVPCPDDHVFIKDYSENSGILAALVDAKVIGPAIRVVNAGFTYAHECKLLMPIPPAPDEFTCPECQTSPCEVDVRTQESNELGNVFPF